MNETYMVPDLDVSGVDPRTAAMMMARQVAEQVPYTDHLSGWYWDQPGALPDKPSNGMARCALGLLGNTSRDVERVSHRISIGYRELAVEINDRKDITFVLDTGIPIDRAAIRELHAMDPRLAAGAVMLAFAGFWMEEV